MTVNSAITRWIGFLGFWMLLAAPDWAVPAIDNAVDMAVAVLAAAAATWTSLYLLPPMPGRLRYGALIRLTLRLLRQSVVSSVAVLLRAFSPRLSISPGFLVYRTRIAPGSDQALFGALTSMLPGTISAGTDGDGGLVYHCLDLSQPVEDDLAVDEALLIKTLLIETPAMALATHSADDAGTGND